MKETRAYAWKEIKRRPYRALVNELERWEGTPWSDGNAVPGVAASCWGAVSGVLASLCGVRRPPRISCRTVQGWKLARKVGFLKRMRDHFAPNEIPSGWEIEAGDVILFSKCIDAVGDVGIVTAYDVVWSTSCGGRFGPRNLDALTKGRHWMLFRYLRKNEWGGPR